MESTKNTRINAFRERLQTCKKPINIYFEHSLITFL